MPKFLERKLASEAASKGMTGEQRARYVYGTLNHLGAMRGNQDTPKGRAMQATHARDVAAGTAAPAHPGRNLGRYLHPPKGR